MTTNWLKHTNFAHSTLAAQLLIAGNQLTMATGEGARFPHASVDDHFQLIIWSAAFAFPSLDPNREIVHAHYNSTDVYDITRAQEGTSAKQWEIGDKCALVLSAQYLTELENVVNTHQGFVDRGDPSASDLTQASMTADGAWHDWDLSAIVPAGATAVLISAAMMDDTTTCLLELRKNGISNTYNAGALQTQVATVWVYGEMIVACDVNRVIEYRTTNTTISGITLIVRGWWV